MWLAWLTGWESGRAWQLLLSRVRVAEARPHAQVGGRVPFSPFLLPGQRPQLLAAPVTSRKGSRQPRGHREHCHTQPPVPEALLLFKPGRVGFLLLTGPKTQSGWFYLMMLRAFRGAHYYVCVTQTRFFLAQCKSIQTILSCNLWKAIFLKQITQNRPDMPAEVFSVRLKQLGPALEKGAGKKDPGTRSRGRQQ